MTKFILSIISCVVCFPAFSQQNDSSKDFDVTVKGTTLRVYLPGLDPRDPVRVTFQGGSTKVQKTLWRSDDSSELVKLHVQSKDGVTASKVVYSASINVF